MRPVDFSGAPMTWRLRSRLSDDVETLGLALLERQEDLDTERAERLRVEEQNERLRPSEEHGAGGRAPLWDRSSRT